MTNQEIMAGLLGLAEKATDEGNLGEALLLTEAVATILETERYASSLRHPASQTSNGEPVATFFNNVVRLQSRYS